MRAGIIADDLTGACDAAARASLAGWRVSVLLSDDWQAVGRADIVAVSTATRNEEPVRACVKVKAIAEALLRHGVRPVYKKIDSMLRGPWTAEVAAGRDVLGATCIAVCPAFPAVGRTVVGGVVHDNGKTAADINKALQSANLSGGAIVGDARTEDDLREFVLNVAATKQVVLWAGSGGMAQFAFGQAIRPPIDGMTAEFGADWLVVPRARKWLVFSGSNHPATQAQLRLATERGLAVLTEPPTQVPSDSGMLLVGGDTCDRVAQLLHASAIRISGEALPGMAIGRWIGGDADGMPVMTKSGGFGSPDYVLRAIERFTDQ